jgi:hypothetical protein
MLSLVTSADNIILQKSCWTLVKKFNKKMTGIPQIEITETAETLREIMKQQKSSLGFAKVQSLYLSNCSQSYN